MSWVAGVDGCRGGWIVVLVEYKNRAMRKHSLKLCPTFADILALDPQPAVIAIDMPIGLLDTPQPGGRECDRQARKLLGRKASSIFTPPTRPMLKATHYEQVRTRGLSIQSFNILPKIREVDRLMTPELQTRIHEAAPELAFMMLAGAPMRYNKKTQEGREERRQALRRWLLPDRTTGKYDNVILSKAKNLFSHQFEERFFTPLRSVQNDRHSVRKTLQSRRPFPRSLVAQDDLLDAYALAWTAMRINRGEAKQLPTPPPVDAKGLKMEIWR
ncbi:MAG: DUF429 domain-containing protein [Deltaproteobacteria bacterium]|nr:DUF429 domain-containing protein [Deltaproteobacteria bacterium]